MSGRHRTVVAALILLGILAAVLLVAFAGSTCPVETEAQPCPGAARNLTIWTNYRGLDPDNDWLAGEDNINGANGPQSEFQTLGIPSYYIVRFNLGF